MKKILNVINPHGFCPGVTRAIKIINETIEKYPSQQIYVFNEIVHNKTVVTDFREKGIIFTQDCNEIKNGSIVILSAHGVSPQVKEELKNKSCQIIDATCPFVTKVHNEVHEYSAKNYHIIYVGKKGHDEVRGVMGENPGNITLIENEFDFDKIPSGFKKHIVLNQTTLNLDDVEILFEKIKKVIPNVEFPPKADLCMATKLRQNALKKNLEESDLILVIGSQNSSNSKKLRDIALSYNKETYLIDNYKEIKEDWLKNKKVISLTAGASAPEFLVEKTIKFLNGQGFENQIKPEKSN
jgi:4-hydroxy-3-methylbut-2-enyl diphosphate reductase